MKVSNIIFFLFLFPTIIFPAFGAVSKMKPGLWENQFIIKSQSGKVEKAMSDLKSKMASMPAEQRKMMEEIMAKQGLGMNSQANSVKICISKEQAENLEIPQGENENCTHEVIKRTSHSIKMKFQCTGERATSGEGEFTLTSPTAYTGKSVINTSINGKADRMDMNQKGKWLSSDCGEIKPVSNKK